MCWRIVHTKIIESSDESWRDRKRIRKLPAEGKRFSRGKQNSRGQGEEKEGGDETEGHKNRRQLSLVPDHHVHETFFLSHTRQPQKWTSFAGLRSLERCGGLHSFQHTQTRMTRTAHYSSSHLLHVTKGGLPHGGHILTEESCCWWRIDCLFPPQKGLTLAKSTDGKEAKEGKERPSIQA